MSPEFQAFASGFPVTALHAAASLVLWAAGVSLYLALFKDPPSAINAAGALRLCSALIGLAMPLAVSLTASASLIEIGLWGLVLILVQLLGFRLIDLCFARSAEAAAQGGTEGAGVIAAARFAAALIVSAAVAG